MRTKIKKIEIRGLRGIKGVLPLALGGQSILIYGDNGSGKSSISDGVEWFYYDRIEHLAAGEIGRDGIRALRNVLLEDGDEGSVSIQYTKGGLDSTKTIRIKKDSLVSRHSNTTDEFEELLDHSRAEQLILRYRDLLPFIIGPRKLRLDHLSDIIGFREVSAVRGVLKNSVNELRRKLKEAAFDDRINDQQGYMLEYFGHNITSEKQFVEALNELIRPLKLSKKIASLDKANIAAVLKLIAKPEDTQTIELIVYYNKAHDTISRVSNGVSVVRKAYVGYLKQFQTLATDLETISRIILDKLLQEGITVLSSGSFLEDQCPLCLEPKKQSVLLSDLERRIEQLKLAKAKKAQLDEAKDSLEDEIDESRQLVRSLTFPPKTVTR